MTTQLSLVAETRSESPFGIVVLPARFDVHEIDSVTASMHQAELANGAAVIDASSIEMVDLAALDALTTAAAETGLRITRWSTAFEATLHYTDRELLTGCLVASGARDALAARTAKAA